MEKLICGKVIRNFPYDYVFLMSHGRSLHGRRSSRAEVFLGKVVLKICSKFTKRTPISKCDFNKVALQASVVQLYYKRDSGTSVFR